LKPYEVQLVAEKIFELTVALSSQKTNSSKSDGKNVAVSVVNRWEHHGFVYTVADQRLRQLEPNIMPSSIEIFPKAGREFVVRTTPLVYARTEGPNGWRIKTADGKIRFLPEGNMRLTVKGEAVAIQAYDGHKTTKISLKSKRLLIWCCHEKK